MNMQRGITAINSGMGATDEAESWFVRLLEADCPATARAAFEQWRAASQTHADAYAEVEQLWTLSHEAIAGDPLLAAAGRGALRQPAVRSGRRWLAPALALAALLVLAVLVLPRWVARHAAPAGTEYATLTGQQRTVDLRDGSSMVLDTDSDVVVSYGDDVRRVDLRRGRAQFHVHGDKQWPFVVHANGGTVTAVGTMFQVRLDGDRTEVTLLEGRLAVATLTDHQARHASLVAKQQLEFARSGLIGPVQPADMVSAEGWTQGKLFVHDWRLPALLAEMNRYSATRLEIGDPALRDVRISGVFRTGDQQTLLQVLQQGWSIQSTQTSSGRVVLTRK